MEQKISIFRGFKPKLTLILIFAFAAAVAPAIDITDFHVDLHDTRHIGFPHFQIETPTGSFKYHLDGRPVSVGGRTPPQLSGADWRRIFSNERWRQQILNASNHSLTRNTPLGRVAQILRQARGTTGRLPRALLRQAMRVLGSVTVGVAVEMLASPSSAYAAERRDCGDGLRVLRKLAWDSVLLLQTRAENYCLYRHLRFYSRNTSLRDDRRREIIEGLTVIRNEIDRSLAETQRLVRNELQRSCVDREGSLRAHGAELASLVALNETIARTPFDEPCDESNGTWGRGRDGRNLLESDNEMMELPRSENLSRRPYDHVPTLGGH